MEDAIIFNKAAVERGLASSYRMYKAEVNSISRARTSSPSPRRAANHGERHPARTTASSQESEVKGGDILIGRTSPPRFMEEYGGLEVRGPQLRDTSVGVRPTEEGTVDGVFITKDIEGRQLVKVKVRSNRVPELGDKFVSRHGQKGVIGMLVAPEDMPFSVHGTIPDIIINPHAFPSRMTVGQFMESLAGKTGSLRGEPVDGTPFDNEDAKSLASRSKMSIQAARR
jgi:DNA-directed RNA polymerase subunit B